MKKAALFLIVLFIATTVSAQYTWYVVLDFKKAGGGRQPAVYQAKEDPTVLRIRAVGSDFIKVKNHFMAWLQGNEGCDWWCHPDMDTGWTCYETEQAGEQCTAATGIGWTFWSCNFSQQKAHTNMFSKTMTSQQRYDLEDLSICPKFGKGRLKNVAPPVDDCPNCIMPSPNKPLFKLYGWTGNKENLGPLQHDECWTKEECVECEENCAPYKSCKWCRPDPATAWACYDEDEVGPGWECAIYPCE